MNANNTDGNESGSLIQKWIDLSCGIDCSECTQNKGNFFERCGVLQARKTEKNIEEQMRVMYPKIFAEMRGKNRL